MASRQQFDPLCDLHHAPMRRLMLDEDAKDIRSFHACARPDCTRIFRDCDGYLDFIEGSFDTSRSSVQKCPLCGSVLFLAAVDHSRKIESWDCPQTDCDFTQDNPSPSAR